MGIFSFLGKKDRQQDNNSADKKESRQKPDDDDVVSARIDANSSGRLNTPPSRDAARSTAMKIDAIESEMSSELVKNLKPTQQKRPPQAPVEQPTLTESTSGQSANTDLAPLTLPPMGMSTDFLLGSETGAGNLEISLSETDPAIEEAAIMFASEQNELAEQMLRAAIQQDMLGDSTGMAWRMLFDLYQITGKEQPFHDLAIDYASKFETSPPTWEAGQPEAEVKSASRPEVTPGVAFTGKLDGSIGKLLDRIQKLSETNALLRVDFARVTEVDPVGCGLLLSTLKKLQKSGKDLVLIGAAELTGKIRSIIEVGRRDETEAPWLLLLEILQLLNRESEFEEASIDYCVTFEVSPPAFVAPKNKIMTGSEEESAADDDAPDSFAMPATIDGRAEIIAEILAYAGKHNPVILDCSRLTRVDFNAAGQLLSSLVPLVQSGRLIEFREVNYMVTALFTIVGLKDIANVFPRKNT